jgi:membrane fusion protein (multidrug efflux system)
MNFIGRHPFAVAFVAAFLALTYFVVDRTLQGGEDENWNNGQTAAVLVEPAGLVEFVDSVQALGTAHANESVAITAKVTETVRRISFTDGQMVKKGDVLVELTDAEEAAQLDEARATYDEAVKQLTRVRDLVKRGTAAQTTLDTQRSLVDQAKARIDAIEVRLADRLIRAPFDGRLGLRQISVGALVTPGTVITTLDDILTLKLDFTVPEVYLDTIKPGQQVLAQTAAFPNRQFEGEVAAVDTRIDPVTRSAKVRALLPNKEGELKPGLLMTVNVTRSRDKLLAVPETAVSDLGSRSYLFVLADGNHARQREVTLGRRKPGFVQIISGLAVDELVITQHQENLRDGDMVRVTPSGNTPGIDVQASKLRDSTPAKS